MIRGVMANSASYRILPTKWRIIKQFQTIGLTKQARTNKKASKHVLVVGNQWLLMPVDNDEIRLVYFKHL